MRWITLAIMGQYDDATAEFEAVAALADTGAATGTLTVRVPGGEVVVTITDATSYLRGPSVLVARGEISEEWWQNAQRTVRA